MCNVLDSAGAPRDGPYMKELTVVEETHTQINH